MQSIEFMVLKGLLEVSYCDLEEANIEIKRYKNLIMSMAERIHGQSQLLSRRAENKDESGYQG